MTTLDVPVPYDLADSISLTYDTWSFCIVIFIFFLVIGITIVGNGLVFAALIRFTRLRSMSNVLIGNLALSDFLLALTILPLSAVTDATGHWLFGAYLCDIWLAVDVFYCTASVWSLVAIAFDRFTATTFPIWYRSNQTQRRVLAYIVIVWFLSGLICLPGLLGWGSKAVEDNASDRLNLTWLCENRTVVTRNQTCASTRTVKPSTQTHVFNRHTGRYDCVLFTEPQYVVYSATGSFVLPLIIMLGLYLKIFIVLRTRGRFLRENQRVRTRSNADAVVKAESDSAAASVNTPPERNSPVTACRRRCDCCRFWNHFTGLRHERFLFPTTNSTGAPGSRVTHPGESSDVRVDPAYASRDSSEQLSESDTPGPWVHSSLTQASQIRNNYNKLDPDGKVPTLSTSPPSPLVGFDDEVDELPHELNVMLSPSEIDHNRPHHSMTKSNRNTNGRPQSVNTNQAESRTRTPAELNLHSGNGLTDHLENSHHLSSTHCSGEFVDPSSAPSQTLSNSGNKKLVSSMKVGKKKRGSAGTGSRERELARADYRERRATKRMGLIIFIFILCWIPFTLMYLVRGLCGEIRCPDIPHLRMFVTWLGYANSALNPILYAVFNGQFRQAFLVLLRCSRHTNRKNVGLISH